MRFFFSGLRILECAASCSAERERLERAKASLPNSRRLESKGVACSLARQSQIDPRPLAEVAGRSQGRPFMFWFYWDTAWSVIISGIMFATIVAHPDAEVRETWRS